MKKHTLFTQTTLLLCILFSISTSYAAPMPIQPSEGLLEDPVDHFPVMESIAPAPVQNERHFWVRLAGSGGMIPSRLKGGSLTAGYQWNTFGAEIRATTAQATYGGIFVKPSYTDLANGENFTSINAPKTEFNRVRSPSDPWQLMLVEPGLSVHTKLFTSFLPLLSEKARGGISLRKFKDKKNAVHFSALLFSVEGALKYQLSRFSPWSIELSTALNWGSLTSKTLADGKQNGRLPVVYIMNSVSLLYWF